MPFGLMIAGATYHRLVIDIFRPLLDNTMEAYIDAMLVKLKEHLDHIQRLQEAFDLLQKYDMKLNPLKCSFGVSSGQVARLYGDPKRNRGQSPCNSKL